MTKILLRLGSRGPEVKSLQEKINSILIQTSKLRVDGKYGDNTSELCRDFRD